jgi:predicted amidophosphoribosyltransferase
MRMQSILRVIYPAQCLSCRALTETEFGLCGTCWRDTVFIGGLVCDACGTPLPGDPGETVLCDDCMRIARPWSQGRAAMLYKGVGRKLVLALKHGDRTDLAGPAGAWMAQVAGAVLRADTVVVPVPLHWTRLLSRRYNQAALLAQAVGRALLRPVCPDALVRTRRTGFLNDQSRDARFATMQGVIRVHPRRTAQVSGRAVLLVDDVMTSGATLAAATEACHAAGATEVCILTLARVAKDT